MTDVLLTELSRRNCPRIVVLLVLVLSSLLAPACRADIQHWFQLARETDDLQQKLQYYSNALDEDATVWQAWSARANVYNQLKEHAKAEADANEAIRLAPKEWGPWYNRGQARHRLRNSDGAIADATEAIKRNDGEAASYGLRCEAYRLKGDHSAAIRDANKALSIDSNNVYALINRAASYAATKEQGKALDDYNRALEIDPEDLDALRWRLELLIGMQRYDDALADCDYLGTELSQPEDARSIRARIFAIQGKTGNSVATAKKAVDLESDNPSHWFNLAVVQSEKKQWTDAIASLDRAISLKADFADAFAWRGDCNRRQANYARCVDDCTKALTFVPKHAMALGVRGAAYSMLDQFDEALDDLTSTIELEPNYRFALDFRAQVYFKTRQWDLELQDANRLFNSAQDDPQRSDSLCRKAEALRAKQLKKDALDVTNEAVKLHAKNAWAYFERAQILRLLGQAEQAIEDCDRGLEINPEDPFGWHVRGVTYSELGKPDEAERDLKESLRVDKQGSHKSWNHAFLADAARQKGDYESAIRHASQAADFRPRNAHALAFVVRGASHRAKGDNEKAVEDFTQAIAQDNQYAYAWAGRGAARRAAGQHNLAVEDFNQAIELSPAFDYARYERAHAELENYRGAGQDVAGPSTELPAILMDTRSVQQYRPELGGTAKKQRVHRTTDTSDAASTRPYTPEAVSGDAPRVRDRHALQRAANDFRILFSRGFQTASSTCGLARCLYEMGQFDQTIEVCDEGLSADGEPTQLHVIRAWADYATGRDKDGVEHAHLAFQADNTHHEARLAVACGHALLEEWEDCRRICDETLALQPSAALGARFLLLWYVATTQHSSSLPDQSAVRGLMQQCQVTAEQWPGLLVQALADNVNLEDFAGRLPDDDEPRIARQRLCQALYYFGMRDLGIGRIAEAREKLRRAVQIGLRQHVEYTLADSRLRRLGG